MPEFAETPKQRQPDKKEQPARALTLPPVLSEKVSKYAVKQDGILRIIGEGEIGDKARSLNRDAEGYRKAGLVVSERTVLAQSVLEDFLRFNYICNTLEEGNKIKGIDKLILDPQAKFPPELEAAIAKELAVFPESGITKELLDKLPKSSTSIIENYALVFERFLNNADSAILDCGEAQLRLFFSAIGTAAASADGWEIVDDRTDMGIRWQQKRKTVALNDSFCAVLTLNDGIEGDKEWMEYRAAHPPEPTFSIMHLHHYSPLCPAVARSSAIGDDEGTGAYGSYAAENSLENALDAIKITLASYYSPKARDFRENAKTGEGFGIILEKMSGNIIEKKGNVPMFAPLYSGVAVFEPGKPPTIGIGFGFGGTVEGAGDILEAKTVTSCQGKMSKYIQCKIGEAERREGFFDSKIAYEFSGQKQKDAKANRTSDLPFAAKGQVEANAFSIAHKQIIEWHLTPSSYMDCFDLSELFSRFNGAAKALGRRRVEFAVSLEGEADKLKALIHVVQSSIPTRPRQARLETPVGELVGGASDMHGSCNFTFRKIFRPTGGLWMEQLPGYEQNLGEQYVLLLEQKMSSSNKKIFLSNAKGAITFGEAQLEFRSIHYSAARMLEHFGNFSEKTGRFVSSSREFPFVHGELFYYNEVKELVLSGIPLDSFRGAFLEYNGSHHIADMGAHDSSTQYFFKRLPDLQAGSSYDSAYFIGRDHHEYRAYKAEDGTINFYREYNFGLIEAPQGQHFHAVGNNKIGLRIYLCKDE